MLTALETYTSFVLLSAIGGLRFPVTVSLAGLLWVVARLQHAAGYSTGDPKNRYQSALGAHIWTSLLIMVSFNILRLIISLSHHTHSLWHPLEPPFIFFVIATSIKVLDDLRVSCLLSLLGHWHQGEVTRHHNWKA